MSPPLPRSVRAAVLCFLGYGVVVVLNAILLLAGDWGGPAMAAQALLRFLAVGVLAGGLVRRRRWAWWISVVVGGVGIVLGVFAAVVFATTEPGDLLPYPTLTVTLIALSVALLGTVLALLLSPSARAAFRRASPSSSGGVAR